MLAPEFYDDLHGSLSQAWKALAAGVGDRDAAFHTVQVATIGLDNAPRVRTVVLRAVDTHRRTLRFHTDARSPKVAEIERNPGGALHAYDPAARIQLRMMCRATVHSAGPEVDLAWAETRPFSRICYRTAMAPGVEIEDPREGVPSNASADPNAGRDVFRTVTCRVESLDWLFLAHSGHRRAQFTWDKDDRLSARWLVP